MVFEILNQQGLCDYYTFNDHPGQSQRETIRNGKFAYLDQEAIIKQLIHYADVKQQRVRFFLPQIHCSSCLYLLEHFHRIRPGVFSSEVNFTRKEVSIAYDPVVTTLRQVVEGLTSIGYEPYISLHDMQTETAPVNKTLVNQLGVAGFAFGNIMLLSFPEYLGLADTEAGLLKAFQWFSLILSLPVLLYSAIPFYQSSLNSLRHRYLNIDTPIALAIGITFIRSVYEVVGGYGSGYFDSMTGIVFFMLIGRWMQDRTHRQLRFDRDYTHYFPIAVTAVRGETDVPLCLPDIKPGETLRIHSGELIPADSIVSKGKAYIDYSFVTGESVPVLRETGEIVYAGGRQTGAPIELLVIKEVSQSHLTRLWNQSDSKEDLTTVDAPFVDRWSRYFTWVVLILAIGTGIYWSLQDPIHVWPAVTSIFIIACPCALLLASSFTNGQILRLMSRFGLYLRHARVIDRLAESSHIVFDKTGTLTEAQTQEISYQGKPLNPSQFRQIGALAACSNHPLSKQIARKYQSTNRCTVNAYNEHLGAGIEGLVDGDWIRLGNAVFVGANTSHTNQTRVYVAIENLCLGYFTFGNHYREAVPELLRTLRDNVSVSVLSGDHSGERVRLMEWLGPKAALHFEQSPADKLAYIQRLEQAGARVVMVGDGLNDAGALKASSVGLALAEGTHSFTPASDGILHASRLTALPAFIQLSRANRPIIVASFVLSIFYNVIGLYFAIQGLLSPLLAAILMPSSTLSIIAISFLGSRLAAKRAGLIKKVDKNQPLL
jgi:Cu+-exporting ATPase